MATYFMILYFNTYNFMHFPSKTYFTRSQLKSYIDQHNSMPMVSKQGQPNLIEVNGETGRKNGQIQKKENVEKKNSHFPLQNFAGIKKESESQRGVKLKNLCRSLDSNCKVAFQNSFGNNRQRQNRKQVPREPRIVKVSTNKYEYEKFNTEITQYSSKRQEIKKYLFGKYSGWMKQMNQQEIIALYESIAKQRRFYEKKQTKYKLLELQRNVELIQKRSQNIENDCTLKNRLQGLEWSIKQNRALNKKSPLAENYVDDSDCFVINIENYKSRIEPVGNQKNKQKNIFQPKQKFPALQKHVIIHHSEYSDYSYSNSVNLESEAGKQQQNAKEQEQKNQKQQKIVEQQGDQLNYEKLYKNCEWMQKWMKEKQRFQIFVELSNIPSKQKKNKESQRTQIDGNTFCLRIDQNLINQQNKKYVQHYSNKGGSNYKEKKQGQKLSPISIKRQEKKQGWSSEKTRCWALKPQKKIIRDKGSKEEVVEKEEKSKTKRVEEFTRQNKLGYPTKKVHLSLQKEEFLPKKRENKD